MPRLKQMKMQGIDAWMCHHPVDEEARLDDLGCSRCPRCGWRITRVLTKKALDRAIEQMSPRWLELATAEEGADTDLFPQKETKCTTRTGA